MDSGRGAVAPVLYFHHASSAHIAEYMKAEVKVEYLIHRFPSIICLIVQSLYLAKNYSRWNLKRPNLAS